MGNFWSLRNRIGKLLTLSLFMVIITTLTGCNTGSSSSSTTTGGSSGGTGTVVGVVASNSTGNPISGATVTVGTLTTTTASDGSYSISGIAVTDRAVVNINASNYSAGSKITSVFANETSRADAALLPVAYTATLTSIATAQTVTVPNSTATVMLPANGLQTDSSTAPSGNISVSVTPIDPSSNAQIMPGDYVTSAGEQIESMGALDVSMRDATGAALNLAPGSTSTIRIPLAAGSQTAPDPTMDLWHYNTTTGQWVNEGTLTLMGTAPNQYYEGTVTHFSTWNADKRLSTTCITGKVLDASGNPVNNARIDSEGQGYVGTSTAYSAADGTFTIKIKAGSFAILTAKTATTSSNSVVVMGGAAGTTCSAMTSDLVLGSNTGSAKIKLSWGTNPGDLDSHLTGPIAGSATRFHVYFSNPGSLIGSPNAELDVDDVSSFGPEIITINSFTPGVYRYSVHHYSGTGDIPSSPARVELTLNGITRVFTPPASGTTLTTDSVWVVMELTVDNAGAITVTPINTYTSATASSVQSATPRSQTSGSKSAIVGGNW